MCQRSRRKAKVHSRTRTTDVVFNFLFAYFRLVLFCVIIYVYLFVVYFTTLPVAQAPWHRMREQPVNSEMGSTCKEETVS
jgi:hypothetical protein